MSNYSRHYPRNKSNRRRISVELPTQPSPEYEYRMETTFGVDPDWNTCAPEETPREIDDAEAQYLYDLAHPGVDDLAFEHQDIFAVDDPLPPDRPNDLYVDRLVIVSNWRGDELPAFTDGLSSDGALIVAHVYSPFSQSWPRCLLTHSQVSFTNASRAQEQALVTALRKLQCAPADLRAIVQAFA